MVDVSDRRNLSGSLQKVESTLLSLSEHKKYRADKGRLEEILLSQLGNWLTTNVSTLRDTESNQSQSLVLITVFLPKSK